MSNNRGRKFVVVIMAVILLAIGMAAGVIAAYQGVDLAWLGLVLPILASVLPSYIGANTLQKSIQAKNQNNQKNGETIK